MRTTNPALQWERYAQQDPYYGVLAGDEYRRENLTPEAIEHFYADGRQVVDAYAERIQKLFGRPLAPERALDFGCGLGRILAPLAERSTTAVGVDVAPTMLQRCKETMEHRHLGNVRLIHTSELGTLDPDFDFVHSRFVFQHIPTRDGYRLLKQLLRLLAPGGIAVINVTTTASDPLSAMLFWTLRTVPLSGNVWNLIRGRAWTYPRMDLYPYSLSRTLGIVQEEGIRDVHVQLQQALARPNFDSATLMVQKELPA